MDFKSIPIFLASLFVVISPGLVATANSIQSRKAQIGHIKRCNNSTNGGCGGDTNNERPTFSIRTNYGRSQIQNGKFGNVGKPNNKPSSSEKPKQIPQVRQLQPK